MRPRLGCLRRSRLQGEVFGWARKRANVQQRQSPGGIRETAQTSGGTRESAHRHPGHGHPVGRDKLGRLAGVFGNVIIILLILLMIIINILRCHYMYCHSCYTFFERFSRVPEPAAGNCRASTRSLCRQLSNAASSPRHASAGSDIHHTVCVSNAKSIDIILTYCDFNDDVSFNQQAHMLLHVTSAHIIWYHDTRRPPRRWSSASAWCRHPRGRQSKHVFSCLDFLCSWLFWCFVGLIISYLFD